MKRKLALLLVLALTLSLVALAGCSKDASSDTPSGSNGETIRIGFIGPLSGNVSVYGIAVRDGMRLAEEEINAAGGINGKMVEVVEKDDQGTPEETVNMFNELVSDGVKIIVGAVTSGCTSAITSAANEEGVLLITPSSTSDPITTEDDYVFRTCYSDAYQGAIAATYCKENGITEVGVVYCAADTYSKGLYDAFVESCEGYGITIAATASTDVMEAQDFTNQFQSMINAGVSMVYAPYYYNTIGAYLVPQARQAGYEGVILGADGYDGAIDYISEGSGQYFDNVYYTNHYDPTSDNEKIQTFVAAFGEKYEGATPASFAALAYDAMTVLKEGMTAIGSEDAAALRDQLADTSITYECVTGTFHFDESGTPVKGGVITTFTYNEADGTVGTAPVQTIESIE